MPCYEIKWREVYEMKTMVVAPTYEEALMRGTDLVHNSPSLDLIEEWKGDEAVTYTEIGEDRVEAELVDKNGFTCLPLGLDNNEQKAD
jgi:hypothetical protein